MTANHLQRINRFDVSIRLDHNQINRFGSYRLERREPTKQHGYDLFEVPQLDLRSPVEPAVEQVSQPTTICDRPIDARWAGGRSIVMAIWQQYVEALGPDVQQSPVYVGRVA